MLTRTHNSPTRIVLLAIVSLLLQDFAGCSVRKHAGTDAQDGLVLLAAWRDRAESFAKRVKSAYGSNRDQYKESERRYIGAQARVNALLDRLVIDLGNNVDLSASEVFENALDAAVQKSTVYMGYMQALFNVSGQAAISDGQFDRKPLNDSMLRLWQQYRNNSASRREATRAELRKLKWRSFEAL